MVQKLNKYAGNLGLSLNFQPTSSSGLNINHSGGVVAGAGAIVETAAGSIAVPDNIAWTVYIVLTTGVLTSIATASLPTSDILILWDGITSNGVVTLIRDVRSWTNTANIPASLSFNSLLVQYNMVFEYSFATAAGLDVPNTGSAGSAHDLDPGGTDPLRGIVGGDVNGSVGATVGVDSNNQAFDHPGTGPSDFTDWDNLASTGSIVCVFRTTQERAFDAFIADAADDPGSFHYFRLNTKGDPNGVLFCAFVRSTNSQDSRVDSDTTFINTGDWVVAVITQPGGGGGMKMYIDGIDVGDSGGSAEPNNWFPTVAQNWDRFHIGSFGGVTSPFKGDVDYFGVTESVLVAADALELTNAYNGT